MKTPLVIHVSEHGFLLCRCLYGLYEKQEKREENTRNLGEEQEIQHEPYDII